MFWPNSFSKFLSDLDLFKTYKVALIQRDSFFTVTLAPLSSISYLLPCFVLLSDNCINACSRNITDYATTPDYKEKINLKILCAFLSRPNFISWPRKVSLMFLLSMKILFYPLSFNVCKSGSILLQVMFCISLFGQSVSTLGINLI